MKDASFPKPQIGTFIDPLTDFGFKLIFGKESSKELLIGFLNELFKGKKVIKDITIKRSETLGPLTQSRTMVFDILCIGVDGEQFIIEMQRIYQFYFIDRSVFYCSRLIHNQAPKGNWNYKLKEVYFIGILDYIMENSDDERYVHKVSLAYEGSGREFYNKLSFIYIEMPKFTKRVDELKSGTDKWLYALKNMGQLTKVPAELDDDIFSKLFSIAEVANLKKEDFMNYERDLMAKWDEYAAKENMKYLRLEAEKKGMEKGMEKGKTEIIRNLIVKLGLSDEQAADIAEMPIHIVKEIRASLGREE